MDIWHKFEAIHKKMLSGSCYQENFAIRIGGRSVIFEFEKVEFFHGIPLPETVHFVP